MNLMTGNFTNKRIGNTQMTNHAGNPVYGYGSLGNNESGFGEVGGNMDYQHSFKRKGNFLLSLIVLAIPPITVKRIRIMRIR